MNEKLIQLRKKALALPDSPGVYIMKNKQKQIIYIGKAKVLRNRVSQYFTLAGKHDSKVSKMVSQVDFFDYIITNSEFEALILECNLIKHYKPKYNILLKDDKGYHYIRISDDEWAKITYEKQKNKKGLYLGPYNSAWVVKNSVDRVNKIFSLPTCKKNFKEGKSVCKPCLNYYIKQCIAPCMGKVSLEEYRACINEAIDYLKGNSKLNIKDLQKAMLKASDNLDFETAIKIRNKINAIKGLQEKQSFVSAKIKEIDVISLVVSENKSCFAIFRFSDYCIYDKEDFLVEHIEEQEQAMARAEFIKQYYMSRKIPPIISIDGEVEDIDLIAQWLTLQKGSKVKIVVPIKGDQKRLIDLCQKNASEKIAQYEHKTWKEEFKLKELKELLDLKKTPSIIEAYDISNLGGTENVGAMVVFKNGKPLKKSYRKFNIKGIVGQDDYASMREVLTRRLDEYEKHRGEDAGFGVLPDLILLDGGSTHVATILPILKQKNVTIAIFGMVKNSKHKTDAIATVDGKIDIKKKRNAFTLISEIQDEVHRFAISFHRKKRSQTIKLQLTQINGIGEKRAKDLLKHFKTIDKIKTATITELQQVPSVNKKSAEEVYNFFH